MQMHAAKCVVLFDINVPIGLERVLESRLIKMVWTERDMTRRFQEASSQAFHRCHNLLMVHVERGRLFRIIICQYSGVMFF